MGKDEEKSNDITDYYGDILRNVKKSVILYKGITSIRDHFLESYPTGASSYGTGGNRAYLINGVRPLRIESVYQRSLKHQIY